MTAGTLAHAQRYALERNPRWRVLAHGRIVRVRSEASLRPYGLTVAQYEAMEDALRGCCPICERECSRFVVDHDHRTGAVRGLLCYACNSGLGQFRDSPRALTRALDYLSEELHT